MGRVRTLVLFRRGAGGGRGGPQPVGGLVPVCAPRNLLQLVGAREREGGGREGGGEGGRGGGGREERERGERERWREGERDKGERERCGGKRDNEMK